MLGRRNQAEFLPHLLWNDERADATFDKYLETANPTIFVVEDKREVIGFLVALLVDYGFLSGFFVTQEVLYVKPEKRGTRAAAHLIKLFNSWADSLQPNEVHMGIANGFKVERNSRFIEHFGFKRAGTYLRRIPGETHG